MFELFLCTAVILALLTGFLIVYTFEEKEPLALVIALFCLWVIYISAHAAQYADILPMKKECEQHLTRAEKCVFVAVPESSLEDSSKS